MKLPLTALALTALVAACGGDTADRTEVRSVEKTNVEVDGNDGSTLVTIDITGVRPDGGPIYIALQDTTNFAQVAALRTIRTEPTGEQTTARMIDVPMGTYAFSAFQDLDDSQSFTIGSLGPNEPYGFSGPIQNGYPEYDLAASTISGQGARVAIELLPPNGSPRGEAESRPVGADATPPPTPQPVPAN